MDGYVFIPCALLFAQNIPDNRRISNIFIPLVLQTRIHELTIAIKPRAKTIAQLRLVNSTPVLYLYQLKNPQTREGLGAVDLLPMGRRRHRLSWVGLGWVDTKQAAEGESGQSNGEGEEKDRLT